MRTALILLAKAIVGGILLYVILTRVPVGQAWAAMRQIPPTLAVSMVALYFVGHVVNGIKLRLLLPQLSFWQAQRFTFIAVFFGTALPSQMAGEAVKALRMMRTLGGDVAAVGAAVVLDKVIGLFALLLLTALGLGLGAQVVGLTATSVLSVCVGLATVGVAALILMPPPAWLGRWGQALQVWRETNVSPEVLSKSLALGLVHNSIAIAVFALFGDALGLHITLAAWAVVLGVTSAALLLPVTVAGIGIREASLVGLLTGLGQSGAAALALSLAVLALTLSGALVGLIVDLAGRDKD